MRPEAYDEKKWRGLKNLQSALSRAELDDHHYGYSTAHYKKFMSLSDLLHISLIVIEKIDDIPYSDGHNTVKEMMKLSDELRHNAEKIMELSVRLKNEAERWSERNRCILKD